MVRPKASLYKAPKYQAGQAIMAPWNGQKWPAMVSAVYSDKLSYKFFPVEEYPHVFRSPFSKVSPFTGEIPENADNDFISAMKEAEQHEKEWRENGRPSPKAKAAKTKTSAKAKAPAKAEAKPTAKAEAKAPSKTEAKPPTKAQSKPQPEKAKTATAKPTKKADVSPPEELPDNQDEDASSESSDSSILAGAHYPPPLVDKKVVPENHARGHLPVVGKKKDAPKTDSTSAAVTAFGREQGTSKDTGGKSRQTVRPTASQSKVAAGQVGRLDNEFATPPWTAGGKRANTTAMQEQGASQSKKKQEELFDLSDREEESPAAKRAKHVDDDTSDTSSDTGEDIVSDLSDQQDASSEGASLRRQQILDVALSDEAHDHLEGIWEGALDSRRDLEYEGAEKHSGLTIVRMVHGDVLDTNDAWSVVDRCIEWIRASELPPIRLVADDRTELLSYACRICLPEVLVFATAKVDGISLEDAAQAFDDAVDDH